MLENSSLVYCIATAKYGWEFPHVGGLVTSYIFDITVVMGIKLLFFMMLKRKIYLLIKVHYSAPFLTPITLVVVLSDLWQFGESKMIVFFFFSFYKVMINFLHRKVNSQFSVSNHGWYKGSDKICCVKSGQISEFWDPGHLPLFGTQCILSG